LVFSYPCRALTLFRPRFQRIAGLGVGKCGLEWGEISNSGDQAGPPVTRDPQASGRCPNVMAMTEKVSCFVVCSIRAAMFDDRRPAFERIVASSVILE